MSDLAKHLKTMLTDGMIMSLVLAAVSAGALSAAFLAEHAFGLEPCLLCLYQRLPFAIAILLSLVAFWSCGVAPRITPLVFGGLSLTFLVNAAIAAYHTGVERQWWKSFLEGCAVPSLEGNIADVLAKIEATTEAVRCDEIPWQDPVLGLSMANYNVILCLGLAAAALLAARCVRPPEGI